MSTRPNVSAAFEHRVVPADTALALGSGDVEALGTPRVLALAEQATVRAVVGMLDEGQTSVGIRVELEHLLPVPVGEWVHVYAELAEQTGRRLLFEVRVSDSADRLVAVGRVTRALVERAGFGQRRCVPQEPDGGPGRSGQRHG